MQLRICDLRNAKFQGETMNRQPSGFGILLDQNYTFLASEWANGNIVGPALAIFGDSTKIYGDGLDKTNQLAIYSKGDCKIFKNNNKVIFDSLNAKILFKLQIQERVRPVSVHNRQTKNEKAQPQFTIKYIMQRKYTKQNYINNLQQLLEIQTIPSKFLTYQNYIKDTFKAKYKSLLNIFQSSNEFAFSFFQDGIFIKLNKKQQKILSVGASGADKKVEIGRKYTYFRDGSNYQIQQSIQSQPSTFIEFEVSQENCKNSNEILASAMDIGFNASQRNRGYYIASRQSTYSKSRYPEEQWQPKQNNMKNQQGRPKQCIKYLRQYYKRSLAFTNKYMNLNSIYECKVQFEHILTFMKGLAGGKYAQNQLQNNGYKLDAQQQPIIDSQNQVKPISATVEDWKKQLDRTIGGRDRSRKTNTFNNSYSQSFAESQYTPQKAQNSNEKRNKSPYGPTNVYSFKSKQTNQNPENKQTTQQRERIKKEKPSRQIKYLEESDNMEEERKYIKMTNQNSYSKNISIANKPSRSKSPIPFRFKYSDDLDRSSLLENESEAGIKLNKYYY